MKVGIFVQTEHPQTWGMLPVQEVVRRIELSEEQGFASAWLGDHAFIQLDRPRRSDGHDPLIVLAHAAARTRRIQLGPLVLCAPFRHPNQVAREAAALADASSGRFVLGLGAGWHRPEFDAQGLPFDHLVSRFEECVDAVRRLLGGGRVSMSGRYVQLHDAELFATAPAPPVLIAGKGPRMIRLAARMADAWNIVWGAEDPASLLPSVADMRRELDAAGRDRASFSISAGVTIVPSHADDIMRVLDNYEQAKFDEVILSLAPDPGGPFAPQYQDFAAEALRRRGLVPV